MRARARQAAFWAILIAVLLALAELGSYAFAIYRPDHFDGRGPALAKLQSERLEQFKSVHASPTLGWDNPQSRVLTVRDCLGADLSLTFGPVRERLYGKSEDAVVVIAGDSFTEGGDVGDSDTYPAALERILGVPTVNLGAGGFDPVQALLKLEATIAHFPNASPSCRFSMTMPCACSTAIGPCCRRPPDFTSV